MYRDIDGFDGKEIPAVMASFVSLFLRMDTVRQFGLPIAEFFIWSDDWEYTRRISLQALPCYSGQPGRACHAEPGHCEHCPRCTGALGAYRYFYRNDVVLYRREGAAGWLWLLAKDAWHTVQVLRDPGSRAERIGIIWKALLRGGEIPPADTLSAMNLTESICRRAARADAVAFDVFDTLIKRDTATPTELFRMRGEAFYTARIEAERAARAAKGGG